MKITIFFRQAKTKVPFNIQDFEMREQHENFSLENLEFGRILAGDREWIPTGNQKFFRLFNRLGVHINILRRNSVYEVDMIANSRALLHWAKAVILDAQEKFATGTWGTSSNDALQQLNQQTKHALDQIIDENQ